MFNKGDEVYVEQHGSPLVRLRVERVTKTQAILGGVGWRFNRTTGRRIGGGNYIYLHLRSPKLDARYAKEWAYGRDLAARRALSQAVRPGGDPDEIRAAAVLSRVRAQIDASARIITQINEAIDAMRNVINEAIGDGDFEYAARILEGRGEK